MPGRSLTLRLVLLFAGLSTLILLALGAFVGDAVEAHFEEGDLAELHGKLALVRHTLGRMQGPTGLATLSATLDATLVGHPHLALGLVDAAGRVRYASPNGLPEWLLSTAPAPLDATVPLARVGGSAHHGGGQQRGLLALARSGDGQTLRVAVALDIAHHRAFMATFQRSLWLAVAAAILLNGLFAWIAARRGLVPLGQLTRLARGISSERLHERLDPASLPAELGELAEAFNGMLVRLEDSFVRLSGFSSDIAHELRTPVTTLMTQAQVALGRARSADEYREVLYASLEEYERLSRMIGDMLFLAQAENGLMVPNRETVYLVALVAGLCDFYGFLAEDRGVRLACSGQACVRGDALMLRRALGNLISNALRYTASGGEVQIELAELSDGRVEICVRNPGEAIPAEHQERIFERFHRVDPARERQGEGAGLGLAITRSIVVAHGGSIGVASARGWNQFCIRLPG